MAFSFSHCNRNFLIAALLACAAACSSPETPNASLVVTGARVWTGDPAMPWAEAVAVSGKEIVAVGPAEDIAPYIGDGTEVIAAEGGMLVPGFIDAHVHFLSGGSSLASVQLRDAPTPEEYVFRIAAFARAAEPGEWITGGAWDHTNWGGELPRRDWIDAITPDNPVWISRLDGHMALANSLALQQAGIDADTPDVAGGEIIRDANGEPTGILKDNAMSLVQEAIPEPTEEQLDAYLDVAMEYVSSHGVTTDDALSDDVGHGWASEGRSRS